MRSVIQPICSQSVGHSGISEHARHRIRSDTRQHQQGWPRWIVAIGIAGRACRMGTAADEAAGRTALGRQSERRLLLFYFGSERRQTCFRHGFVEICHLLAKGLKWPLGEFPSATPLS